LNETLRRIANSPTELQLGRTNMKTITLTQPWAALVAVGAKKIETRSWNTSYRGPLAIHAAKSFPKRARELCLQEPFMSALSPLRVPVDPSEYLGKIVAITSLVNVFRVEDVDVSEPERSFGDYSPGRFAWLLGPVRALPEPVPAKGALGLWDWKMNQTWRV
jgi:hypothetical protein